MIIPAIIYFVSVLSPSHQPAHALNSDPNWMPYGFVEYDWQSPKPTVHNLGSSLTSDEKNRVINQNPYLMVGSDGSRGGNAVSGFNKSSLKLDLWIPLAEYDANEAMIFETYDLCHSKWDLRADTYYSGSGGKTVVTLVGDHAVQAGHSITSTNSWELLDNDSDSDDVGEDCNTALQTQQAMFSKTDIAGAISPITFAAGNSDGTRKVWNPVAWNPDTGLYNGDYVDYINFRILVRAHTLTVAGKYYNMFRLNARFQNSNSKIYLTYPRAYPFLEIVPNYFEAYNNHGMSFASTMPDMFFQNNRGSIGRQTKFSTSFITAIPVDLIDSCETPGGETVTLNGLFGVYDHDYHYNYTFNGTGRINTEPEITVSSMDRAGYTAILEAGGSIPSSSFSHLDTFRLNGELETNNNEVSHDVNGVPLLGKVEVHSNIWEMIQYEFRADRVYKIKFSNIRSINFTQLRVPFDAISAMQSCEADPVIEIDCKNGILFFSKLEWEENPDARLEVKLVDLNTHADVTFISYTSVATGLISNVSYTQSIYIQGDYSNSDPPDNDSIILKLLDPDNQRNVDAANRQVLVNDRVLFLTGRYSLPDPNNPGLYLPLEPDDPNDGLEPAEFRLDVIEARIPSCIAEDIGEVKIEASGCRIYVSHLWVHLPSLGIDYLPDVRLSIPSSPITTVDLSQPTPPPDADIELFLFDGNDPVDQARMATILGYNSNNYRITHYQDDGGTWRPFSLNPVLVEVRVDLSGLDCPPDDPPNPCTLTDPRIFSGITGPGGNSGRTIRSKTQSSTIPGSARNWSHWHYRWEDTDGDPDTPDVRVRDWLDSGTSIRERGVSDNIDVTFSDFDAVLTLAQAASLAGLGEELLIDGHEIDTATGLINSAINSDPTQVKLQPRFDANGAISLLFATTYQINHTNNNPDLSITSDNNTFSATFSITSHRIRRPGSSSFINYGGARNNGDSLLLTDSQSKRVPAMEEYEWEIKWRLTIRENVSYSYSYRNHIEGSWDDGEGDVYYDYSYANSGSGSSSNTVTYNGTWEACSRTLVIKPPDCRISYSSLFDDDWPNEIQTETFDPDVVAGPNPVPNDKMFPVGRTISRTQMRVSNNNPFNLQTNSAEHPTFDVSRAAPYSNGPATLFNDESADKNYQIRIRYYDPGDTRHIEYYHEPKLAIDLPGKYDTEWTVNWQTDTAYAQNWPAGSTDWRGSEHTDDRCQPPAQLSRFVYIYAEPPTCRLEYEVFDILNPDLEVKIVLENGNAAPMDIEYAGYKIHRAGSSVPDNQAARVYGLPSIPAEGERSLSPTLLPITEDGIYDFVWAVRTGMGNEKWTTLDLPAYTTAPPTLSPPSGQNSWFEDRDERITTFSTAPDGSRQNGDICSQTRRLVIMPYLKVFYGDIGVGGHFGRAREYDACANDQIIGVSPTIGHLAGHAEFFNSQYIGSSTNYGLGVHNAIIGFHSANARASPPLPSKGLTLGNRNNSPPLDQWHNDWGGQFGRARCLANYWRGAEGIDNPYVGPSVAVDLRSFRNNEVRRYDLNPGPSLNIHWNGASNADNLKATVYAHGDVYIEDNIINGEDVTWNAPADIGIITIIVKGNIYIAPQVTRLDAVLVAYPNEVAGVTQDGEIWTCYSSGIRSALTHFRGCRGQLVINGALIAQKVRLGRIDGSVKQDDPSHDTSNTRAGEIINLLPEYWLATPELPFFEEQLQKSDSFTYDPVNF